MQAERAMQEAAKGPVPENQRLFFRMAGPVAAVPRTIAAEIGADRGPAAQGMDELLLFAVAVPVGPFEQADSLKGMFFPPASLFALLWPVRPAG